MKHLLFIPAMLLAIAAYAQPQEVTLTPLQDYYYIGSERLLDDRVNCFVLEDREQFEDFFGTTRRADTPDFSKEWMLVLVAPETKKDIMMKFTRVSMKAGNFLEVYCDLGRLKGKLLTYEHHPLAACIIPKYENIRLLKFYEEHKKGGLLHLEDVQVN